MVTNYKFRIFIFIFFIKVNICASFYIGRLHFNGSMICMILFINYVIYFINIHFFDNELMYLSILFFKVLINLSPITDTPSLCVEYVSIFPADMISLIYFKIRYLYLTIFCLACYLIHLNFFEKH